MSHPSSWAFAHPVLAAVRHLLAVAVAAAAGLGILIGSLLIWPPKSALRHADAIVVLSGDHGERLPLALRLLRRGVAAALVLDGQADSKQALQLCAGGQPFEVICLLPRPDNTASEARAAAQLSSTRHWASLIVVTTNDHVLRARMRFHRCFKGPLGVEGAPLPTSLSIKVKAIVHEWFGTIYATFIDRGC